MNGISQGFLVAKKKSQGLNFKSTLNGRLWLEVN